MNKKYRIVGVRPHPVLPGLQTIEVWRDEHKGDNSACAAKFDLMKRGFRTAIYTTHAAQVEELREVRR